MIPHLKVIKSEAENEKALARVEVLRAAKPGSSEQDELQVWTVLFEQFEDHAYPIATASQRKTKVTAARPNKRSQEAPSSRASSDRT